MSLTNEQIAEAFCSHRFGDTFQYMGDEIKWNHIGGEELVGKEAVIAQCEQATKFLATISSTITKLKTYCVGDVVILEGAAQFKDRENQISGVASCDVFRFSEGRLIEITSYVIDLKNL